MNGTPLLAWSLILAPFPCRENAYAFACAHSQPTERGETGTAPSTARSGDRQALVRSASDVGRWCPIDWLDTCVKSAGKYRSRTPRLDNGGRVGSVDNESAF